MAKGTGGNVWRTSWSTWIDEIWKTGITPLRILNFHYRIFTPLWL